MYFNSFLGLIFLHTLHIPKFVFLNSIFTVLAFNITLFPSCAFSDSYLSDIIMTDNFENGNFCTEIITFPTSEAKAAFFQSSMLH